MILGYLFIGLLFLLFAQGQGQKQKYSIRKQKTLKQEQSQHMNVFQTVYKQIENSDINIYEPSTSTPFDIQISRPNQLAKINKIGQFGIEGNKQGRTMQLKRNLQQKRQSRPAPMGPDPVKGLFNSLHKNTLNQQINAANLMEARKAKQKYSQANQYALNFARSKQYQFVFNASMLTNQQGNTSMHNISRATNYSNTTFNITHHNQIVANNPSNSTTTANINNTISNNTSNLTSNMTYNKTSNNTSNMTQNDIQSTTISNMSSYNNYTNYTNSSNNTNNTNSNISNNSTNNNNNNNTNTNNNNTNNTNSSNNSNSNSNLTVISDVQNMSIQLNNNTDRTLSKNKKNKLISLVHNDNNQNSNIIPCGRRTRQTQLPPNKVPSTQNINSRLKLVQTIHGFPMYVDSKDSLVSVSIASTGTWEPQYINLLAHILRPGHNVLNVGSQSGLQAIAMGKIIGPTGKLFIFQPYSTSNQIVNANVQLNNLTTSTKVYKIGASDRKTKASITVFFRNTGGSQITPAAQSSFRYPSDFGEVQSVQLDKIDDILPRDVQLDFALLDVQKMEVPALRGMQKIIERSPNLIIMCEWQYRQNPRKNEKETLELLNFLIEKGYKFYSYYGGSFDDCSVGQFQQYKTIQDLLSLDYQDVFFIPDKFEIPA